MLTKPVEVWCVVGPEDFPLDVRNNEGETWADLCQKLGQSRAYLERVGYRCERRLLVKEGETVRVPDGYISCELNWLRSVIVCFSNAEQAREFRSRILLAAAQQEDQRLEAERIGEFRSNCSTQSPTTNNKRK